MANELAQSFSLASHAMDAVRRTNLARDVSQAELGLRSLALGQQQQQLGQNAIRLQQEQQKINMARADQSMDFFAKFAPLVGADMQKEMFGHVAQQYVQAGVLPEGSTIEFPDVEEAGLEIQSLANRGMPDRAFSRLDELKRNAFKADLPLVAEIEKNLNLSEKAGSQKNLISNRQNGLLFSESEWARHMQGNPDDRRRENGEVQIAKDEVVQAVDLRSRELNLLRKIPAPILNEAMTVKRLADAGVVVSDEKLQLAINTQEAGNLATLIAEQESNGHPVPQFLYDALDLKFAQIGVGEKVPRHDEATRQELQNAKTQERLTNARIANMEVEQSRVQAHTRVLEATVPQIEANIAQMQKLGENTEARTKLFQQQLLTEQKRMRAVAPRLIQERDKLSAEGEELFAEMEALSKDRNADPVALDDLGMKIAANVNAVDDLNAQIEFAEAVGPDLFLKYEQLGARIEDMKARREKGEKDLDTLKSERTRVLTEQTLQKMDIERLGVLEKETLNLLSGKAAKLGILDDPVALTKLIDEHGASKLVSFGDIQKEAKGGKSSLAVELNMNQPTKATQTAAQGTQDEGSFALTLLDELEKTVETDTVGALGKLRGLVHGAGQQASAFGRKLTQRAGQVAGEIAAGEIQTSKGVKPNTVNPLRFFDPKLTEFELLSELAAYEMAAAIANQEGRGLSDKDVQNLKKALQFDASFTGPEQILTTIKKAKQLIRSRMNIAADRLAGTPTATKPTTEDKPLSEMSTEDLLKKLLGQ